MKREFLQDYQRRETEEILAFIKRIEEGKFAQNEMFPSQNRFTKIHNPVVYRGNMGISIWPLIAFSGSAVIPLMPVEMENFEKLHHFQIDQIEEMVSFTEETGKIQFVLMRKPTDYYKLDFLDPIFERLRPPQFIGIPIGQYASDDLLRKYYKEFTIIANQGFRAYVRRSSYGSDKRAFDTLMTNLRGNYMMIRAIVDSDLSNDFADAFTSDYESAMRMMDMIDVLILRPLRNPLRCVDACTLDAWGSAYRFSAEHLIQPRGKMIPCELGRLLMRKLTYYPESLEACKQLTAQYDEQDIIKLFNAVNEGILHNDPNTVEKNEQELSVALNNIWTDKSIQNRINGIKFGVPLILGAIGQVAEGLSGAYVGLLSGLGFDALDTLLQIKGEAFSENISKALARSYQAIIFDFHEKYKL